MNVEIHPHGTLANRVYLTALSAGGRRRCCGECQRWLLSAMLTPLCATITPLTELYTLVDGPESLYDSALGLWFGFRGRVLHY